MIEWTTAVAGIIMVGALVGLGIFVYPWLLQRRGGVAAIAVATAALAALSYQFDRARGESAALSAAFALLWALAPAITAVIVRRLTR